MQDGTNERLDLFPRSGLIQEHQIDIGMRRQFPSAVAPQGHQTALLHADRDALVPALSHRFPIAADDQPIDEFRHGGECFRAGRAGHYAAGHVRAMLIEHLNESGRLWKGRSGRFEFHGRYYNAVSPVSPVRMRTAALKSRTKILPSPMLPVLAAREIVSSTRATCPSCTATSILTFGTNSIVYSWP